MSTNWKGYLLKVYNKSTFFPGKFIQKGTYNPTPNQRAEVEAYREDYSQDLHRVTATGLKTKISFQLTRLTLEEKIEVQNFFKAALDGSDAATLQRKVHLTYWNDEDNSYKDGYFYEPDITWSIDDYDNETIYYPAGITISLVEY